MADNKKSIVVYSDWIEIFDTLSDDEAGKLIKHFFRYVNDLNPTPPDRITELSFIPLRQALKRDLVKWEKTIEGRSKAGKASAEMRKQNATNSTNVESVKKNPTNPTVNVNDNVSVNVSVNDNVNDIKFNFKKSLLDYGFSEDLVSDWLIVRKNKKASNTETAFKGFISEIEQRPCNLNETLAECIKNSWSGFKWNWIDNLNKQNNTTNGKQTDFNNRKTDVANLANAAATILSDTSRFRLKGSNPE